ncbi:MAG: MBL fold metallo-hydrolase RNA specificity domain-containing protein, partial [Gammaproteobacteria bacterium]
LGSAYVECRITPAGPGAQTRHRVVFSGDLGAADTPLLPEPLPPTGCDTLVIESTYGDTVHEDRARRVERLQAVIERALRDRGAVLVPAFSIGRTQELLYEIEDIIHRHRAREATRGLPWEELEIVVDSPLAARFTRVYQRLRGYWDAEARTRLREGRHPLSFEQLRTVDSHADHRRIVEHLQKTRYPAIVLAASGMCAGGRIVNYLKALIGEPTTDVVFVGYQAAGTPGRAIQQFGPSGGWVDLDGERYPVRAGVHTLGGYSAHADKADLLRFVSGMRLPPRELRVVHGDPEAKRALAAELRQRFPGVEVVVPGAGTHP